MKYSIIVADSSETTRNNIANLLNSKGYKVYQATDGGGAIRLARSINPDLVLLDINIWGIRAFDVAKVIENENISSVIFMSNNPDENFYQKLKEMKIYAFINKPIVSAQLINIVEFSLINSNKINTLENKIKKLENKLNERKLLDKAKGILMKNKSISEDEAYKIIRKKSMDECISIEKMSLNIINNDK